MRASKEAEGKEESMEILLFVHDGCHDLMGTIGGGDKFGGSVRFMVNHAQHLLPKVTNINVCSW